MEELIKGMVSELRDFRKETNVKIDILNRSQNETNTKVALIAKDVEFIKEEDSRQNDLIDEHIEGVRQVREQNAQRYRELVQRLTEDKAELKAENQLLRDELIKVNFKAETPKRWAKGIMWVFGAIVTVSGAMYGVYRILDVLKIL